MFLFNTRESLRQWRKDLQRGMPQRCVAWYGHKYEPHGTETLICKHCAHKINLAQDADTVKSPSSCNYWNGHVFLPVSTLANSNYVVCSGCGMVRSL